MGQFSSRVLTALNLFVADEGGVRHGVGETLNVEENVLKSGGNSSTFGTHFLMGGEVFVYGERKKTGIERKTDGRFDVNRPDTFLFGDNLDLELLGNKPVRFPYNQNRSISDSVHVLYSYVNVRRDSVKFIKVENTNKCSSWNYRLEFNFDCDVQCYIQIHFSSKEVVEGNHVQIVSKYPIIDPSEKFYFENGVNQLFDKYTFKPHRHDGKMMHYDGGQYFPVVIEIRTVDSSKKEQVQTTLCSIERSVDQTSVLLLKPLKQKLIVAGVTYLMQEIFGLENKEIEHHSSLDENGGECIICMANPRDTVILPCRHLCICNGCAETLRYKLNNCPICRSPFKALLKLRTIRVGTGSYGGRLSNFTGSGTGRLRHETLTLMEALNGPYQNEQRPISIHSVDIGDDGCERQVAQSKRQQSKVLSKKASKKLTFPLIKQMSNSEHIEMEDMPMTHEQFTAVTKMTLLIKNYAANSAGEKDGENDAKASSCCSCAEFRESEKPDDGRPRRVVNERDEQSTSDPPPSTSASHTDESTEVQRARLIRVESHHSSSSSKKSLHRAED